MSYSLARRSLSRNREILQPVIDERKAMMEKWGDDWTDKPVRHFLDIPYH